MHHMEITLNGEKKVVPEQIDLRSLINSFEISEEGLIVLVNGHILTQEEYSSEIYEGFEVEILRFVSGG